MTWSRIKPWFIGISLLAGFGLLKHSGADAWLKSALDHLQGMGPWGKTLFVGLYVFACVVLLPASVLTLGAGAAFGMVKGFLLVSLAATLGATAAFLLGRGLLRDWVKRRCANMPALAALDQAVAREGGKIVFFLRLSPIIPFNLLNFALGLSPVSLRQYVLSSWLGMMPGTLLYVYIGSLAGDLGTGAHQRGPFEWAMLIMGLLATLTVTWMGTRVARRALNQATRGQA